jgi:Uma2 family endonuclease
MITTAKLFTIHEYHQLIETEFFTENDRIELVKGEILVMSPKTIDHVNCNRNLLENLLILLVGKAEVQSQDAIILSNNSEPEPDVTILRIREDNYRDSLPTFEDVLLVIEVSDSTLKYDQEVKSYLYAESGISDYWIFNLVDNHLEIYSEPYQDHQGKSGYSLKRIVLPNKSVTLPYFPDSVLELSQIFPQNLG